MKSLAGQLNILDRETVQHLLQWSLPVYQLLQVGVVIRTAIDGFFEDRGVGGHPGQSVLTNHPVELTGGDKTSLNIVIPDTLAETAELLN